MQLTSLLVLSCIIAWLPPIVRADIISKVPVCGVVESLETQYCAGRINSTWQVDPAMRCTYQQKWWGCQHPNCCLLESYKVEVAKGMSNLPNCTMACGKDLSVSSSVPAAGASWVMLAAAGTLAPLVAAQFL